MPLASTPAPSGIAERGRLFTAFRRATLAALAGTALLALLAGWNLGTSLWQHARNPVPGEFYAINGRRIHLYCSGAGSPTLVLEAGIDRDWLDWQSVQPALSRVTRVCSYDRSGLGWSEPNSGRHDAEATAQQLHRLLDAAQIQRPLVVVGHSGGGLYVREFAREYPDEVVAMALIDSATPEQFEEAGVLRDSYQDFILALPRRTLGEKMRVWSGLQRLFGRCKGVPPVDLTDLRAQYDAEKCRPWYVTATTGEYSDLEAAARQAAQLSSVGGKPLLILSRDPGLHTWRKTTEDSQTLAVWDRHQESLRSLSPHSRRVIALRSGHEICHTRPDLVVKEVSALLRYLRGGHAPDFGVTVTE